MKAWAIKHPRGDVMPHTIRGDEYSAWHSFWCDSNQRQQTAMQAGYRAVEVEVTEVQPITEGER